MCVALACRVIEVRDDTAVVARDGATTTVSLLAADGDVAVGEWVLVHSGLVLGRLTDADVAALDELTKDGGPR
jgi:hydrogenase assembly chaperone HypC/HupF